MTPKALLIKTFFSLVLLAIVIMQVDLSELKTTAANIHIFSWLYAAIFIFLQMLGLAYRWVLLVNAGSVKHMRFGSSLRIIALSFLANYLFTTSLGGIIARIVLTVNHGFSFIKTLAATILDRCMTIFGLLLLAALFLPLLNDVFQPHFFTMTGGLVFLLLAICFLAASLIIYKKRRAIIFANRRIAICYKYLRALLTDPQLLGKIIVTSLASQVMYFAAVYMVIISLDVDFSFIKFMAIIPVITLISSLPVGYGGWGIREGAFIYGLGLINIPLEAAFMASVQIGLLSMLLAVLTGIPAFIDSETQLALKNWRLKKTGNTRLADARA
jgi:uncharacterized membrane protein YbhN (UPF0104 family)